MTRWTITLFLTAILAWTAVHGQTDTLDQQIIPLTFEYNGKRYFYVDYWWSTQDTVDICYFYERHTLFKSERLSTYKNGRIESKGRIKRYRVCWRNNNYIKRNIFGKKYLQDGNWIYFDKEGNIIKTEIINTPRKFLWKIKM